MQEQFWPPWMADMPKMQDAFFGPAWPWMAGHLPAIRQLLLHCSTSGIHAVAMASEALGHPAQRMPALGVRPAKIEARFFLSRMGDRERSIAGCRGAAPLS
jgi:hypothetical protein